MKTLKAFLRVLLLFHLIVGSVQLTLEVGKQFQVDPWKMNIAIFLIGVVIIAALSWNLHLKRKIWSRA